MTDVLEATPVLRPALLALWLIAAGCASPAEVEVTDVGPDLALDRARASADELGRRLAAELGRQLGSGTPAAAVDVCSEIAPAATGELSNNGLEIRRTSLRYRNPDNAPDAWERAWLERLEELAAGGELPTDVHEVDDDHAELRYLRPIVVGAACLLCHGAEDQLDPAVRRQLAERYPEDRATGFSEGDLRGAFSVRVEIASRTSRPKGTPGD